jgi:WD40 repeat protein
LYDFELKLINRIQAHLNEISFITNHNEFILTSNSQEQIIKIFNNNNLEYINSLREIYPPTALTISKYNSTLASSGYKNGLICIWNLVNGDCKYKLNDTNSIIKLELTENYVISLNRIKTLSIWNLVNGQILNEFQMSLFTNHTKSINHFLCTNKYLITTSKNNDKQKFIFIWTLSESRVLIKKKLSINSKLVDQIKYLNILNNDSLLIHDTNHSIYLLEI